MIIPFLYPYYTVIVANGQFPEHSIPLSFLHKAERIICCDGATEALLNFGMEPDYIVGDLDSLSQKLQSRFKNILNHNPDTECNDLTKAVNFCVEKNWTEITILAATGKREDHCLGNISLIADYAEKINVQMITDYGTFIPLLHSGQFESLAGQQVSIFSLTPETVFTFKGLKYPINEQRLFQLWQGTLNEALGSEFQIEMNCGKALVFREHNLGGYV